MGLIIEDFVGDFEIFTKDFEVAPPQQKLQGIQEMNLHGELAMVNLACVRTKMGDLRLNLKILLILKT